MALIAEAALAGFASDVITAGSVDLSGASRENPVLIRLDKPRVSGQSAILRGANQVAADAEKFAIPGADASVSLVVRNGDLVLKGVNGLLLVVK